MSYGWFCAGKIGDGLHGVRIVKRPASSTGPSRARQGAGPPDGHGFRLEAISLFEEGT